MSSEPQALMLYEEPGTLEAASDLRMTRAPQEMLEEAGRAATALMSAIERMPEKPVQFGGRKHLLKAHWQTLARMFGCSAKVASEKRLKYDDAVGWEATVVVVDRSGMERGSASSMCMNTERNWKGRDEHQIRSMAQTRAMSKAYSVVFGWVTQLAGFASTPAEEMAGVPGFNGEGEAPPPPQTIRMPTRQQPAASGSMEPLKPAIPPQNAAPSPEVHPPTDGGDRQAKEVQIVSVTKKSFKKKNGETGTKYVIETDTAGTFETFSETFAKKAKELEGEGQVADISFSEREWSPGKYNRDILEIEGSVPF